MKVASSVQIKPAHGEHLPCSDASQGECLPPRFPALSPHFPPPDNAFSQHLFHFGATQEVECSLERGFSHLHLCLFSVFNRVRQ